MKKYRVSTLMLAVISFMLIVGSVVIGSAGKAAADDCVALGGALVAGECQISSAQVKSGTFTLDETLHILGGGSIIVPPLPGGNVLTLNITGSLLMDIGAEITGDAPEIGATITVNATEDIILEGNGAVGARITSNQTTSNSPISRAGNIILAADADGNLSGDVRVDAGAEVTVNARLKGGAITITGVNITIDGLVESASALPGGGHIIRAGSGPIIIDAICILIVTGKVSSRGNLFGADLVRLEGGAEVRILGLVESTGRGSVVPTNPPTLCASRPGKPANTTACVEVVAGDLLVIDSTGLNNGEINADTGGPAATAGTSFIDIFARGDIRIIGDSAGAFAAHANGLGAPNDVGGTVTVKSVAGRVTASGRALQADATRPGGTGGTLIIESFQDPLDNAILFARGDFNLNGGLGVGGTLAVRTFNQPLSFQNGEADVRPSATGTITLTACGGINTTGTNFHGVTPVLANACGGAPTLPPYIVLPVALCAGGGSITVTKSCQCVGAALPFTTNYMGQICNNGPVTLTNVTLVDNIDGNVPLTDTVLDPGECVNYNGSFASLVGSGGLSMDTVIAAGLAAGVPVSAMADAECVCPLIGLPPPPCPGDSGHDPIRPLTSIVDPSGLIVSGVPSFLTLQAAVDAADLDEVIGVFGNTTENVTIGGNERLFITQCTMAEITAANAGLPVIDIFSTDVITIAGVDTVGGTFGFLIQTDDHVLRGIRATNASIAAVGVIGDNNSVSFNSLDNSGAGIIVVGDANDIRGGTVANNVSNGVLLAATADNNTFRGARVLSNGLNGILVQGTGNTIRDNGQVNNNGLDGINVTGTGNRLRSNRANNNTGDEFDIGPGNVDQGGNKANNVNCTFTVAGGVCN